MSKTPVHKLTSAALRVNIDPSDTASAEEVAKLASGLIPIWNTAKKPADMSLSRRALTDAWLYKAVAEPVYASKDGPGAAKALGALAATLDPLPATVFETLLNDFELPSLEDIEETLTEFIPDDEDDELPPPPPPTGDGGGWGWIVGLGVGSAAAIGVGVYFGRRARRARR